MKGSVQVERGRAAQVTWVDRFSNGSQGKKKQKIMEGAVQIERRLAAEVARHAANHLFQHLQQPRVSTCNWGARHGFSHLLCQHQEQGC